MLIDQSLISRCIEHDRRAQHELYKKCYSVLMSICIRYEKNRTDAEALLNMGFLKVVTKLEKYNTEIPFEAWIRRIMINTVIDEYRKRKKEQETIEYTDFDDHHYNRSIDFNAAEKFFNAEELQIMINELPTVSKRVFNLHVIDGFSHKEIGDMLEISIGTSKWHVSNARKLLKEKIEKRLNENTQRVTA